MKLKILLISLLMIGLVSCNKIENQSESGSKLILSALMGKDLEKKDSVVAYSDVITKGSIYDDLGTAYLRAVSLNPAQQTGSFYQDIIVDQIDIEYSRPDGKKTEGVDVPYKFVQPINVLLKLGDSDIKVPFVLVRHVAKMEPPLVELTNLGADKVLQLIAKVTIHGKDVAGYRVQPAIGYITIWCANFGDPEEKEEDKNP